ncbi:MAG: LysM domain-containing protein [Deltaproteobacteria bacterium]|nr:LysM domain-containing protein [Deltaproteobacteria bacterium]
MRKLLKHMILILLSLFMIGFTGFVCPLTGAEKTVPFSEDDPVPKMKEPAQSGEEDQAGEEDQENDVDALLEERGFATQEYVVKEGDWLTKILREQGLMKNYDTDELLKILRQLNNSLKNINLIRPGEKIVILVKVMPKKGHARPTLYHTYTIRPGDSLYQLAVERYGLSDKAFTRHYMPLLKEYNPDIENLDLVRPGKKIKLPVYPIPSPSETAGADDTQPIERDVDPGKRVILTKPRIVSGEFDLETRLPPEPPWEDGEPTTDPPSAPESPEAPEEPAEPEPPGSTEPEKAPVRENVRDIQPADKGMVIVMADDMGKIFEAMGEEWIAEGEHFIPMTSGGHINLKTENYPLLRLQKGPTVIVDLTGALPRKMRRLIESTWSSYRVVAIDAQDDLRSALGKVLRSCNYDRIFKRGEPLELRGSIHVKITGDWILATPAADAGKGPRFIVISLRGPNSPPLPANIKDYLNLMEIDVLEYPPGQDKPGRDKKDVPKGVTPVQKAKDPASLVHAVLKMTGLPHTTGQELPAFISQQDDFKLTVRADFYLENHKNGAVIDLSGLDPKVISLLRDRGVDVLSLSGETRLLTTLGKLLKFLHVRYKEGPHTFDAIPGKAVTNVRLTLPGVVFKNGNGESVIATGAGLPDQLVRFLSQKGYRVLVLSESPSGNGQHA